MVTCSATMILWYHTLISHWIVFFLHIPTAMFHAVVVCNYASFTNISYQLSCDGLFTCLPNCQY